MPNARARWATSTPTRPRPTTPSVLPWSSTPSHRDRFQLPPRRSRSACGMLRAWASSSAIVCSAAESTFDCGALTTITPRRVAAATSTLSRPMPARPTTTRSAPASSTSAVTCVALRTISAAAPCTASSSCVGAEVEALVDVEAGSFERFDAARCDLLGDEDAGRAPVASPCQAKSLAMRWTPSSMSSSDDRERSGARTRGRRTPRRGRWRPWPRRAAPRRARSCCAASAPRSRGRARPRRTGSSRRRPAARCTSRRGSPTAARACDARAVRTPRASPPRPRGHRSGRRAPRAATRCRRSTSSATGG